MSVSPTRKRVLFIGHEASRTGAPIMLLTLLRWLRGNSELDFEIVLLRGGPLVEEYGQLGEVHIVKDWLSREIYLRKLTARRDIGLIYANSLATAGFVRRLAKLDCPIICHVHEVNSYFQNLGLRQLRKITDLRPYFVAVTESARTNLEVAVPEADTEVLPGFLAMKPAAGYPRHRRDVFRGRHGIPNDVLLVGSCGTHHWQKGHDLFLLVAEELARQPAATPVHFVWLGGNAGNRQTEEFARNIRSRNLQGTVSLIHTLPETSAYFESLDIFALTSRDDPLPLVVLEAGLHALPVVCFSGNAEPITPGETGLVVPYEDTHQYAESIRDLAADKALRDRLGKRLESKIRKNHDVELAGPHILGLIEARLRRRAPL